MLSSSESLLTVQRLSLLAGAFALAYFISYLARCGRRGQTLPPGPPTVPVLGNLTVLPRKYLHFKFAEWAKAYGDAFSLKVMDQTIIVLNSPSIMKEVIDKRSASSSNRPKSILADAITPQNMNLGTGRFANDTWKVLRKSVTQLLNNESIRKLGPYQRAEATQLMWELAHTPDKWYQSIQRYTISFALGIVYGKRGPRVESKDVADFLYVHPRFMHALEFGTMPPVDLFPILTWVPERFAEWKRIVRNIRNLHETMYDRMLKVIEKRVNDGRGIGVFMEEAILNAEEWGLTTRDLRMHLGGVLLEGSDTTSAALQNIVFCLTLFPEVQKKAYEEIMRVVGPDRVPTWEDIPDLPYLSAVIEECIRYRPVAPLGLPHEMVEDEIIDGQLFPKDAVIFPNLWYMYHDDRYFDRPDEFIPERFLKHPLGIRPDVEDDPARRPNMLFGGGRRVCPGIAFAKSSLEINTANMIWGFEFKPTIDKATGAKLYPNVNDYSTGITAVPKPIPIDIKPRSAKHVEIINLEFNAAGDLLRQYELPQELAEEDRKFNETYRDNLAAI